jgi:hypothetical protein
MTMAAILTIGSHRFFIRTDSAAAAALKALSDATQVDYEYENHRKIYFPTVRIHEAEIGLEIVRADQCRMRQPVPETHRLKIHQE